MCRKNHFLCISSLLNEEKNEEVKEYLQSINRMLSTRITTIDTDNSVFDALLSEKTRVAQDKGITVQHRVVISRPLNIQMTDWCILFGNASG